MTLKDGMHAVPSGHIAAVVTYLQMTTPVIIDTKPFPAGTDARREMLDVDSYRRLFRAVGEPWLWTARLLLDDAALSAILQSEHTETWVIRQDSDPIGLVELDFSPDRASELAYFGMVKAATGRGLGGPMMALAQKQAFARDIDRFFVHTCNWDDPRALAFYQKAGFTPYKSAVEVFADPRIDGPHNAATAPHVPSLP